jgi:hypothetical protein
MSIFRPGVKVLENPPTAKSLLVGAVDRLRLILNRKNYVPRHPFNDRLEQAFPVSAFVLQ